MQNNQSVKPAKLKDTGERMIPEYHQGKLMYGEHIVRYEAVKNLVKNKRVLDIASGSGYGTAILSEHASFVTGVDLNQEAVEYAKKQFKNKNINFLVGNATKIPLEDNSVDVVVSFETIEHIENHKNFMKEVKRVLAEDGTFIVSTPNDEEFPEGADFHVHEFEYSELISLLERYFKNNQTYYQATWLYNALLDENMITNQWMKNIKTLSNAPISKEKAVYFLIICSNTPIKLILEPIGGISEYWSSKDTLNHNAEMDTYIKNTMNHFKKMVQAKDKQIVELNSELNTLKTKINDIYLSRSWVVAKKLSRIKELGTLKIKK